MKRMTLKTIGLLVSTLLLSAVASADPVVLPTVYTKMGGESVVMTFPHNGTAKIKYFHGYEEETLIEGPVTTNPDGSYEIHREEGDVCSSTAVVQIYSDIQLGESAIAVVQFKYDEGAPTGDRLCAGVERMAGTYTLLKQKPLTKRCAPPAGAPVAKCN